MPFIGPYWVALPAVLEVWLLEGRPLLALALVLLSLLPPFWVDNLFYREIEGWVRPSLHCLAMLASGCATPPILQGAPLPDSTGHCRRHLLCWSAGSPDRAHAALLPHLCSRLLRRRHETSLVLRQYPWLQIFMNTTLISALYCTVCVPWYKYYTVMQQQVLHYRRLLR